MIISLDEQIRLVVYSFLAGILTGLLFDIYRILRGFGNPNKILTFIEDTLFWIFTAIVVFVFLLYTNYAYIGMYVYMWIIIGIYIYLKAISRGFLKLQYFILDGITRFIRIIFKILFFPFEFIIYFLRQKTKENKKIT
jgi:spore cortex biosynthesis protein YabQ